MQEQEITSHLRKVFPKDLIKLNLQGNSAAITIVSDLFVDKTIVQRQQLVYSAINDLIQNGSLHAVSIQAYTCSEEHEQS